MSINTDNMTDKKALSHISSSPAFKNNALFYLATQLPQTLNETIKHNLKQLIQSIPAPETAPI